MLFCFGISGASNLEVSLAEPSTGPWEIWQDTLSSTSVLDSLLEFSMGLHSELNSHPSTISMTGKICSGYVKSIAKHNKHRTTWIRTPEGKLSVTIWFTSCPYTTYPSIPKHPRITERVPMAKCRYKGNLCLFSAMLVSMGISWKQSKQSFG